MIADSIKFRGHRCFKNEFVGFDEIKLINVIIGRNSTGKSHLLDLVALLCDPSERRGWEYQCSGTLTEEDLRAQFQASTREGRLRGNHWLDHGVFFINQPVTWKSNAQWLCSDVTFEPGFNWSSKFGDNSTDERLKNIGSSGNGVGGR